MRVPHPNCLLAALALLAPAVAQESALDSALAAIQTDRLRADLEYLASDGLAGRDTPSPGLEAAARYIEARLESLGFQPAGREGWRYPFTVHSRRIDPERTRVELGVGETTERLDFGLGYFPERSNRFEPFNARGAVVSVGRGTQEEFDAAELEGRWGLLYDSSRSVNRATRRAEDAGALGLVITPSEEYGGKPYAERFGRNVRVMKKGIVTREPARERGERLPVLMLPRESAARLRSNAASPWEGAEAPAGHDLGVELLGARAIPPTEVVVHDVCGLWPGSDPELRDEVVIVSAHYDHVGAYGDDVYNGADDNGSGTTGLLAVAGALAAHGPMKRSILLLWVSGEEKGLWGSEAWAKDPHLPEGFVPVCDINIDMIGRTAPGELYVTPTTGHGAFNTVSRAAYDLASLEGFPELLDQDVDWGRSDHAMFAEHLDVPVVFLSAGEHEDYHEPTDTADKIDYDKVGRISRLIVRMLDELQDADLRAIDPRVDPEAFADWLASAVPNGATAVWEEAFDHRAFLSRALPNLAGDDPLREALSTYVGLLDPIVGPESWIPYNDVEVVRVEPNADGGGRVLLRAYDSISRFDYLDVELGAGENGLVVLAVASYARGETFRASIRRMHALLETHPDAVTELARLAAIDDSWLAGIDLENLDLENLDVDDPGFGLDGDDDDGDGGERALASMDDLPEALRTDPDFLACRIALASDVFDLDLLGAALDGFGRTVPEGTALDYLTIEHGPLLDRSDAALAAIGRLEAAFGDAVFAEYLRGEVEWWRDDYDAAERHYIRAREIDPGFEDAYWSSFEVYEERGEWKRYAALLDTFEANFGYDLSEIDEDFFFESFVESPEFEAWRERRER